MATVGADKSCILYTAMTLSPMVEEQWMRPVGELLVCVSALSFLQCFVG